MSNTHLGARVGKLNPTWNQPYNDDTLMAGFLKAVELAGNGAFCCGLPRGGLPPAGHTQLNRVNLTTRGPRQSVTSEIRTTPLSQEVPSARTKTAWGHSPTAAFTVYPSVQHIV